MKIIILALIISISLHFLAFYNYKDKEFIENKQKNQIVEKKSDVKFVKLKKKENLQEVRNTPEIKKFEELKKIDKESKPKVQKKEIVKKERKKIEKQVDTDRKSVV
ncbi:MAG: hypothetical protein RBR65_05625, partial [Aliarcobacter sp.]|nr:hypothetical protein [Aliarcobacter sp.]